MLKRIIPVLLIQNGGLIKTVKFKKPTYIGDPINAVKIFNDKCADELILLDINATKENYLPNYKVINEIVSEAFMPIGYGGGIKDLHTIQQLLKVGVEKVILNYSAYSNREFLKTAVKEFGGSTIVVSMDTKKDIWGRKRIFVKNGSVNTKMDPFLYAKELELLGVGEVFINSIDQDGTFQGYDIELIREISKELAIPVVACGGASSLSDFKKVLEAGAMGAAGGSIFVYQGPHKAVLITYPDDKQLKYII